MPGRGEAAHVRPDLGQDDLRGSGAHPGDRVQDRQGALPGGHQRGDPLRHGGDVVLGRLDVGEHPAEQEGVMVPEPGGQRAGQLRQFAAQPGPGQVGQRVRVGSALDQGPHHVPTGDAHHVGGHRRQLDPGVLEHLVQPVDLAGPGADQRLAIPGQVA
jgi:hypothetical protein